MLSEKFPLFLIVEICEDGYEEISGDYGSLQSPNYPDNYPDKWNCRVKISPDNEQVRVTLAL